MAQYKTLAQIRHEEALAASVELPYQEIHDHIERAARKGRMHLECSFEAIHYVERDSVVSKLRSHGFVVELGDRVGNAQNCTISWETPVTA